MASPQRECISRESNPELGHGKTQCYRYTTNAPSGILVTPIGDAGRELEVRCEAIAGLGASVMSVDLLHFTSISGVAVTLGLPMA